MLILAQVLAIIQGVLAMMLGAAIAAAPFVVEDRLQRYISQHNLAVNGTVVTVSQATVGFVVAGAIVFIIGALLTFLAVRAGHPSQVARWFLAVIEILFLIGALRELGIGGYTGRAVIGEVVVDALIVIGLIIWPTTYLAYARRNLSGTTAVPHV
jgi:hypothetical protein